MATDTRAQEKSEVADARLRRHSDETVREYFETVRPRITEVIDEHSLDVALRSGPVTTYVG